MWIPVYFEQKLFPEQSGEQHYAWCFLCQSEQRSEKWCYHFRISHSVRMCVCWSRGICTASEGRFTWTCVKYPFAQLEGLVDSCRCLRACEMNLGLFHASLEIARMFCSSLFHTLADRLFSAFDIQTASDWLAADDMSFLLWKHLGAKRTHFSLLVLSRPFIPTYFHSSLKRFRSFAQSSRL